jgi:hypothetical protein
MTWANQKRRMTQTWAQQQIAQHTIGIMQYCLTAVILLLTSLSVVSGFASVAVPSRRPKASSSSLSAAPTMVIY